MLLFAHRGASARAPENTLAAFELALRLGAGAIECDVQLSADGAPVILHDVTVDRTTDGEGPVARLTVAALRRLDAGSWFAPRFRDERIPTLEETLEFARGRCRLNLELKAAPGSGSRGRGVHARRPGRAADRAADAPLAAAVARAIQRLRFHDPLIVSSFSGATLAAARAAMPGVRLGLLVSRSLRGLAAAHHRLHLHSLHLHVRLGGARRLTSARHLGLQAYFWTVNDAGLGTRLLALGADGLMTDDPALFTGRHPSQPH